jgi:EAL domain-containing protein (putative c-di-GMP-specific phosphodiesterase class I)
MRDSARTGVDRRQQHRTYADGAAARTRPGSGPPRSPAPSIAIDPVCGMAVDRDRSIALEHDGRLLYFCSRGCRDEFLGVGSLHEGRRAVELVRRVLDKPTLLQPVFQPIVAIETGRVVGYEALARFAPIPLQVPEAWFDLAARAGMTPELEGLAVRRALEVASRRPPPDGAFVSVNLSPLLLGDGRVASALTAPRVEPHQVVLELTERDRVADYDSLRAAIGPYRARGFRIAVDDAGAGYASMRHITELRPDFIKLDARLIVGLTDDQARQALVRALATFVGEIGGTLVAEGVETLPDLGLLARIERGLLVQGNALARPGPAWPALAETAVEAICIDQTGASVTQPRPLVGAGQGR